MSLRVKDWHQFQHYKNRKPPWIRLYSTLIDDPEYHNLSSEAAKALPLIWLAASEYSIDGILPDIKRLAFRMHYDSAVLAKLITELNHWIICEDNTMLAECLHRAIPEQSRAETERETEQRERQSNTHTRKTKTNIEFDIFWKAYPKKVGKALALKAFQKALKSGLPTMDILVAKIEKLRMSGQWKRENGQYIPNPATWLNRGGWDDELPEGPGRKLLPQELAQKETEEWLKEQEITDGQYDTFFDFANDSRVLPGEVATHQTNQLSVGKDVKRR